MQHADILQSIETPSFLENLKRIGKSFWGMVTSGELWGLTQVGKGNLLKMFKKIEVFRLRADLYLDIQKNSHY